MFEFLSLSLLLDLFKFDKNCLNILILFEGFKDFKISSIFN